MSKTPNNVNARTSIYVLKDPTTEEIRYVGKTVAQLNRRLNQHIAAVKTAKTLNHRLNWINKIINQGNVPLIEEIDSCTWEESASKEMYYIKYYRDLGYDLINETDGGEGNLGYKYPEERKIRTKESIREELPRIYQCDKEGNILAEWNSAPDAADSLHINSAGITRVLRGERNIYKGFIWKYMDPNIIVQKESAKNITEDSENSIKCRVGKPQSFLGRTISLENKLINESSDVFIFNSSEMDENSFLYSAASLLGAAIWCIENGYSSCKKASSLKSKISAACSSKISTLGLWFSYEKPEFAKSREKYLFYLETYYEDGSFLTSANSISELSEKLSVNKANVTNYMKCVTKTITVGNDKCKIGWKINNEYCRLIQECIGVSADKIEENPNNLLWTTSS